MTEFVLNEIVGNARKKMPTLEYLNSILEYRDGQLFWKVDKRPQHSNCSFSTRSTATI